MRLQEIDERMFEICHSPKFKLLSFADLPENSHLKGSQLIALIPPVFGMLGFIFHLMVDGRIKNIFSKSFQKSIVKNKPID